MKILKFLFATALVALAMTSCSDSDDELAPGTNEPPMATESHPAKAIELTAQQQDMTKSLQIFSWEIFEAISAQQRESGKNENLIFSPLSLEIELAMLLNGLQGETLQGMLDMMHLSGYDTEQLNQYFKRILDGIEDADNVTRFVTANSLWYDKRYMLVPGVEQSLSDYYDCEFYPVVYGKEATAKINKWVDDRTYGRIKKIIDNTTPDFDFYHLINAVYFRSPWQNKMTACGTKPFTQIDATTVQAKMFKGAINNGYYKSTSQYQVVMLPFSNAAFGMFFLLPNEDVTFSDVYMSVKASGETFAQLPGRRVNVTIPEFEVEQRMNMINSLLALGGEKLLASPIVNILEGWTGALPSIYQTANIKVNEEGAEAAAVTVVLDGATGGDKDEPVYITFDRPFIYGIVERSTGLPLFMGEISMLNKVN